MAKARRDELRHLTDPLTRDKTMPPSRLQALYNELVEQEILVRSLIDDELAQGRKVIGIRYGA